MKYQIDSDGHQWTIRREQVVQSGPRKGETDWVPTYYFLQLKDAASRLVDLLLMEVPLDGPLLERVKLLRREVTVAQAAASSMASCAATGATFSPDVTQETR